MFDLNQAGPQREFGAVIPDGTFVWVIGILREGGHTAPWAPPADANLFKASGDANSDVIMLDWEFTVQYGPFERQKFWQFMTIAGGQLDDHGQSKGGNITKNTLRAMVESANAILPADLSAAAMQARNIPNLRYLDGIPFGCRVEVEVGGDRPGGGQYPDKNKIAIVITPEMPEYAQLRNRQEIAPQPRGRRSNTGTGGGPAAAPAAGGWQQNAPPPGGGQQQPAPPATAPAYAPPPPPASPPPPAAGWAQPQPQGNAAPPPPAATPPGPGWVTGR